jgi:hypothetical protein
VVDDLVVSWGAHDSYRRLTPPARVARATITSPRGCVVADWIEGLPADLRPAWKLTIPIVPPWQPGEAQVDDGHMLTLGCSDASPVVLTPPSHARAHDGGPVAGGAWWSPTYGEVVQSWRLECEGAESVVAWALRRRGTSGLEHRVDEDRLLVIDGRSQLELAVAFTHAGCRLDVGTSSRGGATHGIQRWCSVPQTSRRASSSLPEPMLRLVGRLSPSTAPRTSGA